MMRKSAVRFAVLGGATTAYVLAEDTPEVDVPEVFEGEQADQEVELENSGSPLDALRDINNIVADQKAAGANDEAWNIEDVVTKTTEDSAADSDVVVDAEGNVVDAVESEEVESEQTGNVVDGFSQEAREEMEASSEKHEFQAEVNRLMDIIINSLYTDKEVFLRELISNAADALEKARFHSVQDPSFLGDRKDLEIKLEFDPEAKTLTISDTGVGMSKADLINNLGTVAKSGTANFMEALQEGADNSLIGQFGVGFYSAFLVADKVTVTSKNNTDDAQHVWESGADASFTIAEDPRGSTLGRGSRVTLHLKEDATELLSEEKLKGLCKKFSQFIQFPIYVQTKKEVEEAEDEDDDDLDDDEDVKDVEEDEDQKEKKMVKKTVYEWDQVNTQKAIWLRPKEEVTDQEYQDFFKATAKEYEDATTWSHFNAEGEIEFKSILYIPKRLPYGFMQQDQNEKSNVKFYVRRVLVADEVDDLMPKYLSFLKGVVDSDDLPLNVSREQLQQNKVMKVISKKLVRKAIDMMRKIAQPQEDKEKTSEMDEEATKKYMEELQTAAEDKFLDFFKEFGKAIKWGVYQDEANRSKLGKLLRFHSSKATDKKTSFDAYIDRMGEKQEDIYYMTGESVEMMQRAPIVQTFVKRGLEVLFLDEQMDETCMQQLKDFDGKKLVSIQKDDVKLAESDDEKTHFNRVKKHFEPLTSWMKKTVNDATESGELKETGIKVNSVVLSKRLEDSPCVLVSSGPYGLSPQMERMYKAHGQDNAMLGMMGGKTLELNAKHPVVQDLLAKVSADKDDEKAKSTTLLMFYGAVLESGYEIKDPSSLVKSLYSHMAKDLGVDPNAPLMDVELPEETEAEETEAEEEAGVDEDDEDVVAEEESAAEEPKEEVTAEEPKEEVTAEEPKEEVTAEEPKEEVAAEQPNEDSEEVFHDAKEEFDAKEEL